METSKKEKGKNTELSKIVFLRRKREKLEENRKKEDIKEIDKEEEEVEAIYQDTMDKRKRKLAETKKKKWKIFIQILWKEGKVQRKKKENQKTTWRKGKGKVLKEVKR